MIYNIECIVFWVYAKKSGQNQTAFWNQGCKKLNKKKVCFFLNSWMVCINLWWPQANKKSISLFMPKAR